MSGTRVDLTPQPKSTATTGTNRGLAGGECSGVTMDPATAAQFEYDLIPLLEPLARHTRSSPVHLNHAET
jgi:hypothetical protein